MKRHELVQLDDISAMRCPCGWTQRAFAGGVGPASVHQVQIEADAKTHYHKGMTEIYVILEGEGFLELDGEKTAVRPLTAVMIHPGCRHRAIGKLRLLNIAIPAFDPEDEWFD
jgi:mannose-6-phosphate isomerase-like protein (cupin superfamily)